MFVLHCVFFGLVDVHVGDVGFCRMVVQKVRAELLRVMND